MELYAFIYGLLHWAVFCTRLQGSNTEIPANFSDNNKEMYVIRATVYQVGILTNQTDETTNTNTTGNEEAITYFHTNGSRIDLSKIQNPLLTNVTAQSFVGVAPFPIHENEGISQTWTTLDNLKDNHEKIHEESESSEQNGSAPKSFIKRSIIGFDGNSSVKIEKGTADIPQEVGIQSISIPPLILFNNNLSNIPVPIPNTSVIQYAKVNTLVHMP